MEEAFLADYGRRKGPKVAKCLFDDSTWLMHLSRRGGYARADSFDKHFKELCRDCKNYNTTRAKMKTIMIPKIVWHGNCIGCMKSPRTMQCKICMVKRIEILKHLQTNKHKIINDNSDIFSSCKCGSSHQFSHTINIEEALKMRSPQKSYNSQSG